jgi:hypothetical protein
MRPRRFVALRVAVAAWVALVPVAASAQAPAASRPDSVSVATTPMSASEGATALAEARELIKNGDYDRAIETLRATIARSARNTEVLRDAYLLLIKTYVFLGNDYKFKPQGREASSLNYRAARERIAECLSIPALRQVRPEPATDYPPEMIAFFAEVRGRMFGGFRVVGLEPPNAIVALDGQPLTASHGETGPGVSEMPVGTYRVTVRADGHKNLDETVTISPSATLERSYRLEKRRSALWYSAWVAGAALLVGGAAALISNSGGDNGTPAAQPLPGAPPPPGN